MKKLFTWFLVVALILGTIGMAEAEKPDKINYYEMANMGIAKTLRGRFHVLIVFIAEQHWDTEDKKQYLENVVIAEEWLIKQAKRYGVNDLSFKNTFAGLDYDIIIDKICNGEASEIEKMRVGSNVFQKLGYKSMKEYAYGIKKEFPDCQNFVALFCCNKPGTGYSEASYYGADDKTFLEWGILYTKYIDERYDDWIPANIAHELLHLLGAWDLYEMPGFTREQAEFAKKTFKNEIMRQTYRNFDELEIGPLTAWRIGLTDKQEDWFYDYAPEYYKKYMSK